MVRQCRRRRDVEVLDVGEGLITGFLRDRDRLHLSSPDEIDSTGIQPRLQGHQNQQSYNLWSPTNLSH